MNKRPLSVTIIAWIFIAAGTVGIIYHASEFNFREPFAYDQVWILFVRLLAIAGGIAMLYAAVWGRWLVLAWMTFHVVISFFHTMPEVIMHAAILAVIAFFLFRPAVNAYLGRKRTE